MTRGGNVSRAIKARVAARGESYGVALAAVRESLDRRTPSFSELWAAERAFPPEDMDPEE